MENQEVEFQYANECDLEIHCSPFGLSGLYLKIKGTSLMGVGSTMGLLTGSTSGLIHYNDCQDMYDLKYKLYAIVDDDDMIRIDFTKVFVNDKKNAEEILAETQQQKDEVPTLIFTGKCPEGRPDKLEPFIGIFSFEKEE